MVTTIKKFFEKYIKPNQKSQDEISEHSLQLATAALLVEMMRADSEVNEDEQKIVMRTIQSKFNFSKEDTKALIQLAEEEVWKSTGYYEFTSLINKRLTYEQKVKVIEHLWEVAFSDAELDKHEEHMVRKIADLIYVEHKDFIDTKLKIKEKQA